MKSFSSRLSNVTCDAFFLSSRMLKQCPLSINFISGNNAKLHGARLGGYGGCRTSTVLLYIKKLCHSEGSVSRHTVMMQQPIASMPKFWCLFCSTSLKCHITLQEKLEFTVVLSGTNYRGTVPLEKKPSCILLHSGLVVASLVLVTVDSFTAMIVVLFPYHSCKSNFHPS